METTGRIAELFKEVGGTILDGFPAIHSQVHRTDAGTTYLKAPGVVMLARPQTNVAGLGGFLEGFDPGLGFSEYLEDPTILPDSSQLCKTAGQTCFDDRTEILSENGWKLFKDLDENESVMTLNPCDGKVEFQVPLGHHCLDYDGFVFRAEGNNVSFVVTPDHRQWAHVHSSKGYAHRSTWEIARSAFLVKTAPEGWDGEIPEKIEMEGFDYQQTVSNHVKKNYGVRTSTVPVTVVSGRDRIRALALLCAYCATEGSLDRGEGQGVVIYGDHAREVQDLCRTLGLATNEWMDPRNGCPRTKVGGGKKIANFFEANCGKGSRNKMLPRWVMNLPKGLLKEVWSVLLRTDGSVQKGSRTEYLHTTSPTLAGQAQEILCKLGFGSRVRKNKKVDDRLQGYSVCKKRARQTWVNRGTAKITPGYYKGRVYCVTTENSIVFVRRNGKPHFSGNCYMSFGPRRTTNENAAAYFERLTSAGHGSVLEHSNFSFLFYGISRSVTHELVRHRHLGFSQVSQRYVSGSVLRFVERPEYQGDGGLHRLFEERADRAAAEYEEMAGRLLERQEGGASLLSADYKTDARKKVQQTARSLLPNETEAPMVCTGNVRALRHVVEMRADAHAESEIRTLAVRLFLCLAVADPILFGDYEIQPLPDGAHTVTTCYRKV